MAGFLYHLSLRGRPFYIVIARPKAVAICPAPKDIFGPDAGKGGVIGAKLDMQRYVYL